MKAKRSYREVRVEAVGSGYAVLLDDVPARSPADRSVDVPSHALAHAIADEWAAQDSDIDAGSMPLMRLVGTAVDRVAAGRAGVVEAALQFADTDLLCYRAESPDELAARQQAAWQPLLDWAAEVLDAPLNVASGIIPIDQPRASLAALRRAVEDLDDLRLTALSVATAACGSLVLGLALVVEHIDADEAFRAAHVDEAYQRERWGDDAEAVQRLEGVGRDLADVARLVGLLAQD